MKPGKELFVIPFESILSLLRIYFPQITLAVTVLKFG